MKWCYKIEGGHTHVRVFMNGAKCGDLCFRNEEFEQLRKHMEVQFVQKDAALFTRDDCFFKRSEQFMAALQEIATSSHCSYPDNPSQYAIGVADGHRCAANIAKAAIADDSLAGLIKMGEQ